VIYKEFQLPNHPVISELNKMVEEIRSSTVVDFISGRPDHCYLDHEQLQKRIKDDVDNSAYLRRFNYYENFDYTKIQKYFEEIYQEQVGVSDYLLVPVAKTWYPRGGYLGWHIDKDGGRLYASWADGKSFFRYQDPFTKKVITSWDKPQQWTFRIFTFDAKNPLWHCVGAEDIRVSVGWRFVHK
jgi:hypothetical protein